jgi:hypothetical protein
VELKSNSRPLTFYFQVWFDDSDPLAIFSKEEDLRGVDRWIVKSGTRIENWPEGVTFFVQGEHLEDYLLSVLDGWILVSERVRRIVDDCAAGDVQLLPVRVTHKETQVNFGPYWLLNVIRLIEALDWDHTRWFHPEKKYEDEHPVLDIAKVALNLRALQGVDIFRLKVKDASRGVFISQRLKERLERAGAIGFKFIPVPAYSS